jgi:hypothetical protein
VCNPGPRRTEKKKKTPFFDPLVFNKRFVRLFAEMRDRCRGSEGNHN